MLTKKQVIATFKTEILPAIPANDKPAQRMAWNNYTDSLCKDGQITLRQYETWVGPIK
jgi:hypothetical protein